MDRHLKSQARPSECARAEGVGLPEAKPSLRSKSPEVAPRRFGRNFAYRVFAIRVQKTNRANAPVPRSNHQPATNNRALSWSKNPFPTTAEIFGTIGAVVNHSRTKRV